MFEDNYSYNYRPTDWKPCCAKMWAAVEERGSIEILSNYKHIINWKRGCGCDVLEYCPWCAKDLRPSVTRDRPTDWPD